MNKSCLISLVALKGALESLRKYYKFQIYKRKSHLQTEGGGEFERRKHLPDGEVLNGKWEMYNPVYWGLDRLKAIRISLPLLLLFLPSFLNLSIASLPTCGSATLNRWSNLLKPASVNCLDTD